MNTLQVITELKSYINTLPEDDKKYIEHTLIKLWEKETILPRSFYGVVFVTNKDYGTNVPEQLKNIKRMLWYGNIRK